MNNKKCIICGKQFKPHSFNQYVCMKDHTFKCPVCGKEYTASRTQISKYISTGKMTTCSMKCANKLSIQSKIKKYGKGNNGDKIKNTYKNMSKEEKQINVEKCKQTKLKRYGDSNYNNTNKNNQTKFERYGDSNYNNREQAKQTRLIHNNGSYRSSEENEKINKTKVKKYGKGNNGDKISRSLKNRPDDKKQQHYTSIKQTCLLRYGNSNYRNTEKCKQTKLNKYGSSNYNNRDKAKQSYLEKYGVSNPYQIDSVKNKVKLTSLNRFGVDNVFKSTEAQEQFKQIQIEKYGGIGMSSPQVKQKIINTNLKKYGCKYTINSPIVRCKSKNTVIRRYKRYNYNQTNYSLNTFKILNNKQLFIDFIESLPEKDRIVPIIQKKLNLKYCQPIYNAFKRLDIDPSEILTKYVNGFENDIIEFLDTLKIQYNLKDRYIINPYELDIYIPDKKVAIECNGIYWHSSKVISDNKYHYNKSKLCEEKGIRLIHIFEYEWYNQRQQPILKNIIKNALGINEYKLYARKLKIEIRSSASMKDFFNKNNIQGFRGR